MSEIRSSMSSIPEENWNKIKWDDNNSMMNLNIPIKPQMNIGDARNELLQSVVDYYKNKQECLKQ